MSERSRCRNSGRKSPMRGPRRQDALWKLEIERKNREIKSLGERLGKGLLTREEHLEYGRMISEVKALELRLQADGRSVH